MEGKTLPPILKMLGADDGHMGLYENRIKTFRNWIFPGKHFLLIFYMETTRFEIEICTINPKVIGGVYLFMLIPNSSKTFELKVLRVMTIDTGKVLG